MSGTAAAVKAPIVATLVAVAVAAIGCGDDEPAAGRASERSPATDKATGDVYLPPRLEPSRRTGERAQAAETVLDVQEGLVTGVGESVCYELTSAAEERLDRAGGDSRRCPDVVEEAIDRWRAEGRAPALVPLGRVEIDGREALVTVKDPERGHYQVRVVHVRNEWELPRFDLDRSPGLVPAE